MKRLSKAQLALMMRLAEYGQEESPFGYGRNSGRLASSWHRTVSSLVKAGLVVRERYGDHFMARLTPSGRQWLAAHGAQ